MVESTFEINKSLNQVWNAFLDLLPDYGSIKNKDKAINKIEFKSGLKYNFTIITITLRKPSKNKTKVHMKGHAIEGLMKMGYAERLIDKLSFEISNYFKPQEKKQEYKEDSSRMIWLIVIITLLVLLCMFFLLFGFPINIKIIP